jgi:hypothetical protein
MSKDFAEEVLATLRKSGSHFTKEHRFEFYVHLPTEIFATKAATKIRQSGFGVEVSRSRNNWLVVASKVLVPTMAELADQARFFYQIAAALEGQFDGWEAELMESDSGK